MMVPRTMMKVPTIHRINWRLPRSSSNCDRLWAGSPMAPNTAMRAAPAQVKKVPTTEYRVKDSCKRRVAKAVLKTKPD